MCRCKREVVALLPEVWLALCLSAGLIAESPPGLCLLGVNLFSAGNTPLLHPSPVSNAQAAGVSPLQVASCVTMSTSSAVIVCARVTGWCTVGISSSCWDAAVILTNIDGAFWPGCCDGVA